MSDRPDVDPHPRVQASLQAIESARALNAFTHVDVDGARAAADECATVPVTHRGPLWGTPIAVKQNLAVRGLPWTAGSRILEGLVAPEDAEAVRRLRNADAVVVGLTNMDEFGMGGSSETGAAGPVEHPVLPGCVVGGSSGGSAAAVAAGLVPIALGSDTGGSIRQPAAFCGVVGLKPTWGRVSRRGLVAFASSLDTVGPIAASVAEAAAALSVMAGPDPRDATTAAQPVDDLYTVAQRLRTGDRAPVSGLTVGRLHPHVSIHPDIEHGLDRAQKTLEAAGARIVDAHLPHAAYALSTYIVIAAAEASSNLARYDGIRYGRRTPDAGRLDALYRRSRTEGFGPEVQRRILIGNYVLTEGVDGRGTGIVADQLYDQAARLRTLLIRDYERVFATCDLLLGPAVPEPPFLRTSRLNAPLTMYRGDELTVGPSLAGLPAIVVPVGGIHQPRPPAPQTKPVPRPSAPQTKPVPRPSAPQTKPVPRPSAPQAELPAPAQLIAPWWAEAKLIPAAAIIEAS